MAKITLLGDSIRLIGYGTRISEFLGSGYEVYQPEDNCRFAKYTLRMLFDLSDKIKGSDVIHWNNGLWDVCNLFGEGTFSSVDEYVNNMLRIADILLKITPNVIFATTTPVRDEHKHNSNDDIRKFNEALVPELIKKGIIINDLYSTIYNKRAELIRDDDLIHLNEKGIELCAKQVADCIKSVTEKL